MKMDVGRGFMNGFKNLHAEFTAYDFEWNVELPEGVLDPNIPADYTQIDLGSIAQDNAAQLGVGALPIVVLGLKRWRRRRRREPDQYTLRQAREQIRQIKGQ